jgi:hypothetical protein
VRSFVERSSTKKLSVNVSAEFLIRKIGPLRMGLPAEGRPAIAEGRRSCSCWPRSGSGWPTPGGEFVKKGDLESNNIGAQ